MPKPLYDLPTEITQVIDTLEVALGGLYVSSANTAECATAMIAAIERLHTVMDALNAKSNEMALLGLTTLPPLY